MQRWFEHEAGSNKGSTIVEVSLIMPFIIFIIVFVIFWFMDAINDAIIQGEAYCGIYELSAGEDRLLIESGIIDELNDKIVGSGNEPDISVKINSGEISVYSNAESAKGGNIYRYQGKKVIYKREYDKCTQRLRRWQIYGDKLREQGD